MEGWPVGNLLGLPLERADGESLGLFVGDGVGEGDGTAESLTLGLEVGSAIVSRLVLWWGSLLE